MSSLDNKRLLITSGPTIGPIDAVRFVSNRSSGALGALIARQALHAGAHVTFVHGMHSRTPDPHPRLRLVEIATVDDVIRVMERDLTGGGHDAVVHAMAVLDYVPADPSEQKTASGQDEWIIRLVRTPKAIQQIKRWAPGVFLVGFKLEVGKTESELVKIGHESLTRNNADLVVVNDLTQIDAQRHVAYIVGPNGDVRASCETKGEIADKLVDLVAKGMTG